MIRTLALTAALALAAPAYAQVDHSKMDHSKMDHAQMEHGDVNHGDMDHDTMNHGDDHAHHDMALADPSLAQGDLRLADEPELVAALAAGGEPVVAKVLGAVCDFCAVAMNKTFGNRDEVAAVHVDLDAKTLNLVLKPGMSMSDDMIISTVKKAGYKVDTIVRGDALSAG